MSATTRDTEGDLPEQPAQIPAGPEVGAPAVEPGLTTAPDAAPSEGGPSLLMNAPADRCRVCAAEMAPDQHYCVECGTRRGKPRFELAKPVSFAAASGPTPSSNAIVAGWTRTTALLAVAVVLLALLVGVIIGNAGSSVTVHVTGGSAATTSGKSSSAATKSGSSGAAKTTNGNFFSSGS